MHDCFWAKSFKTTFLTLKLYQVIYQPLYGVGTSSSFAFCLVGCIVTSVSKGDRRSEEEVGRKKWWWIREQWRGRRWSFWKWHHHQKRSSKNPPLPHLFRHDPFLLVRGLFSWFMVNPVLEYICFFIAYVVNRVPRIRMLAPQYRWANFSTGRF